ncbi:unnamed protein product [Rotaria sp. Silwood2]|nr:unnamed protein product [Rotaria sp. Silwood2]CAF4666487.1 unnamed protein product [Rotaria sp. Silwood2]
MCMEDLVAQLNDLPDEILMIIFKKMHNIELLYFLIGVNKRLNKVLHDSIFTRRLSLLSHFSNDIFYQLTDPMLNRFCLQILPQIHDKIEWLDLDSFSMERILRATNYPNLYRLGLFNIEAEMAVHLFSGKIFDLDSFNDKYAKVFGEIHSFELTSNIVN